MKQKLNTYTLNAYKKHGAPLFVVSVQSPAISYTLVYVSMDEAQNRIDRTRSWLQDKGYTLKYDAAADPGPAEIEIVTNPDIVVGRNGRTFDVNRGPETMGYLLDVYKGKRPRELDYENRVFSIAGYAAALAWNTVFDNYPRAKWARGVREYALEMLVDLWYTFQLKDARLNRYSTIEKAILCGARDWKQYSTSGCTLYTNRDIAARLCTPAEFIRVKEGEKAPNSRESWIDVQARALYQAARLVEVEVVKAYNALAEIW